MNRINSSRQSISAAQRITKHTGATEIGVASVHKATMVRISWTDAKVVHIVARKSFDLEVELVEVKNGVYTPFKTTKMVIPAGKALHFVASSREGYYYVVCETSAGEMRCSCPQHIGCKHVRALSIIPTTALREMRWAELCRGDLAGAKKFEEKIAAREAQVARKVA